MQNNNKKNNKNIIKVDQKPFIFMIIILFMCFLMVMHKQYQEENPNISFIQYVFFNEEPTSAEADQTSPSYKGN